MLIVILGCGLNQKYNEPYLKQVEERIVRKQSQNNDGSKGGNKRG